MSNDDLRRVFSVETLTRQRNSALIDLLCGGGFLLMAMGARFRFFVVFVALAALIMGFRALRSGREEEKKPGIILIGAGFLGMVNLFGIIYLRAFAGFILGLGGLLMLASGIWKGLRYLFNASKN